jgi:DNA-directed RNA polymerase subunit RPC12/RpoP
VISLDINLYCDTLEALSGIVLDNPHHGGSMEIFTLKGEGSMDTADVASRFVDLVLDRDWARGVVETEGLSDDEVGVLLEVVKAAGFEVEGVVPGWLRGSYLDQDGSKTGATYPINRVCPFKVAGQDGSNLHHATGWLDCALRLVIGNSGREEREQLVEMLRSEIERSIPLQPVQLTPEGDLLREYPPSECVLSPFPWFVDHTRDDHKLLTCVGVHMRCGGWMDRHASTAKYDVIVCRYCHLRVLFPKEVETYGELRQALVAQNAAVSV